MTGRPTRADDPRRPLSELGLPLLLVLTGAGLLRATVRSDVYLRYVKEGLWPFLVASGALLVVLGLAGIGAEVARRLRQPVLRRDASGRVHWHHPSEDHTGAHHDHGPATRVAWLLAVPALTLLFVAPPALGSYTASRDGAAARVDRTAYEELAGARTTPMALEEFIGRSLYDSMSLRGRKIRLTGFVTAGRSPDTWYLNRLVLSCCAGDARSLKVEMHGAKAPRTDTWVEVTGVWRVDDVSDENPVPALDVGAVKAVDQPRNPYQDAPPTDD
ncbi:TIGR03943 family putative permease subunit [Streptomyces sp. NPDC012769]|uniref:TIGR03943 family putative permease subunit n=1 Tax=Streptomyces sp. NPDC012769 TaxID=3364848 RepID=UPI003682A715